MSFGFVKSNISTIFAQRRKTGFKGKSAKNAFFVSYRGEDL